MVGEAPVWSWTLTCSTTYLLNQCSFGSTSRPAGAYHCGKHRLVLVCGVGGLAASQSWAEYLIPMYAPDSVWIPRTRHRLSRLSPSSGFLTRFGNGSAPGSKVICGSATAEPPACVT